MNENAVSDSSDVTVDSSNRFVLPGFVMSHNIEQNSVSKQV